jgi:hypothetical protein
MPSIYQRKRSETRKVKLSIFIIEKNAAWATKLYGFFLPNKKTVQKLSGESGLRLEDEGKQKYQDSGLL